MIEIRNINSNEFVFGGGRGDCFFDVLKVYYVCEEHTWGENGHCEYCDLLKCDVGEHDWNSNGHCEYCDILQCSVTKEHKWNESGHCEYCDTLQCSVTKEHKWNESGHCEYCDELKCTVTGEHTWQENGHCAYCDTLQCSVTKEHKWNENGYCDFCNILKCTATGEHTWQENGYCKYCNALKCDATGNHTWDDKGHCKYCDAVKCNGVNHKYGDNGHCEYCDEFKWKDEDALIIVRNMDDANRLFGMFETFGSYRRAASEKPIVLDCDIDYGSRGMVGTLCLAGTVFEGNGHTVKGLCVAPNGRGHLTTLFGDLRGATIRNVTFEVTTNTSSLGRDNGLLAQNVSGNNLFENVTIIQVAGKNMAPVKNFGGFVARIEEFSSVTFRNCVNSTNVVSYGYDGAPGENVGGFVGLIERGGTVRFENCINNGNVDGIYAGGFVGCSYSEVSFRNCVNNGNVSGQKEAGGLIAWLGDRDQEATLLPPTLLSYECTNNGNVTSLEAQAGGLAGRLYTDYGLEFRNPKNYGTITGGWTAGGICAESEGHATFDGAQNYGTVIANGSCAGGILGWNSDDTNKFKNCSNAGNVTGKGASGGILGFTGDDSGDQDMYFEDCSNSGRIESKSDQAAGIVGKVDTDGTHSFKDVSNSGAIIGGWSAGGICADIMGTTTFTNATNSGSVTANSKHAAGILSWSENQPIIFTNCSNSGSINAKEYAGGIGGVMYDETADPAITAESCKNSGAVTSQTTDAGGIIGALCTDGDCKFTNCKNESGGNIKGARQVGGIFGWTCGNYTLIKNCSNSGKISTTGSKNDGFKAGTLYGSYENSVTCEGCTNYAASIFTEYSAWIIAGCTVVVLAVVAVLILRKKKKAAVHNM